VHSGAKGLMEWKGFIINMIYFSYFVDVGSLCRKKNVCFSILLANNESFTTPDITQNK
jgi:hypothetical protein